jgi:hypothetical protein
MTFKLVSVGKDSCVYFGVCIVDHNMLMAPFMTGG